MRHENTTDESTRKSEFFSGARDTVPLLIGAAPFGIAYGAIAVAGGLSSYATIAMSLFVFAGSSQFVAAGLVGQGVGAAFIVATTFMVNARHALYATSIGPYLRDVPRRRLGVLAFFLTDETYAVSILRYRRSLASPYRHWYQIGSAAVMYTNWQLWTVIGVIAGTRLVGITEWGLDVAMVVTFIGIVVPLVKGRAATVCLAVSFVVALFTVGLPNQIGIIVAAAAGIAAGVVAESVAGGGHRTGQHDE